MEGQAQRPRIPAAADYAVLGLALAGLAAWSWRKWPDPLIDFGRELYIPWRLSEGAVLYRDIAFFNGPLSQYVNAALFSLFGVSFTTLIFANLGIIAACAVVIYRLFLRSCDRMTALIAGLCFLSVFAFAQYHPLNGSMNFMAPYSHETTHGTALALLMMLAFSRLWDRWSAGRAGLAGLLFGLTALTKGEVTAAAAVAAGIGLASIWMIEGQRKMVRTFFWFGAAAAAPVLLFYLHFLTRMPAAQAGRAVGAFWFTIFESGAASNLLYRNFMGIEDPGANALLLIAACLCLALAAAGLGAADYATRGSRRAQAVLGAAAGISLPAAIHFIEAFEPWVLWTRALPPIMLIFLARLLFGAAGLRHDRIRFGKTVTMAMWAGFALALLAKMILLARFYAYGYYLAMPAALGMAALALHYAPGFFKERFGGGTFFRLAALGLFSGSMFYYFYWSHLDYRDKTFPVGKGGDRFLAYPPKVFSSGADLGEALAWIERETPPGATVTVVPEGVMLNYLSRRVNPTPYIVFMAVEMLSFGEDAMLSAFQKTRPDYFVIVHKDTSDYGVGLFGQDPENGMPIMQWIDRNYRAVKLIGAEPLQGNQFGIKIMKRNDE